ncbi:hypothetical protein DSECCO2_620030 [anaerobic digester metagenome]
MEFMMANFKKQQQTKKKLADAFIELYARRDINRIPVKAITDLAGVNRATFYIYYDDIYDLREQIETYFLEKMAAIINRLNPLDIEILFSEILALYRTTGDYIPILLGREGSPFPDRVKVTMRRRLRRDNPNLPFTPRIEYAMEYQVAGIIGVFGHLLRSDGGLTPEEAAILIKDISTQGATTLILKERKES